MVYFAERGGAVVALDAVTPTFERPLDRIKWRSKGQASGETTWPTLMGSLLVVPHLRSVEAFDAATGAVRWKTSLPFDAIQRSRLPITTAVDHDQLVVGWDNRAAAFSRDGKLRWLTRVRVARHR
jgi:hypothetical protein